MLNFSLLVCFELKLHILTLLRVKVVCMELVKKFVVVVVVGGGGGGWWCVSLF